MNERKKLRAASRLPVTPPASGLSNYALRVLAVLPNQEPDAVAPRTYMPSVGEIAEELLADDPDNAGRKRICEAERRPMESFVKGAIRDLQAMHLLLAMNLGERRYCISGASRRAAKLILAGVDWQKLNAWPHA
jgi:hypothetical protein